MKRLILVPAIALAFGCAMMGGQEAKKSEARTAQDQAHQQLQQAADAQKRAAEEQLQVEKDQQEVVAAQKAVADAQAKLRGQRAKAKQAQDDARRLSEQAQQDVAQQQKQASQLQDTQAQQHSQQFDKNHQEWQAEKDVEGRVLQASDGQLQLRTSDQQTMKLDVTDSTAINLNGHSAKASQIQPGADVRASYQLIDGQAKALTIEVTPLPGAQPAEQAAPK